MKLIFSQAITLTSAQPLKVTLGEDTQVLDEVVVTALGIKRATKALSYNVQEVKGDELTTVKSANFMNSLAGKVAGVNINASSSGVGGATRVVMRGTKSISSDNNALYVIDGVPIFNTNKGDTNGQYSAQPRGEGISDINPEDIESMSVLSGPAAAALYGSNAASGVILITTKKGKEGKARIIISNNSTFSNPFIMPEFQNSYINRAGSFASWGDKASSLFGTYEPKDFFNTGTNIQNNVSLSVGNEKNQTYLSVGTTNATGIIQNSKYDRYNFTFRNTTKFLKDKMTLDVGFSYIIQEDLNLMAQGEYFNPLPAQFPVKKLQEIGRIIEARISYGTFQSGCGYALDNLLGKIRFCTCLYCRLVTRMIFAGFIGKPFLPGFMILSTNLSHIFVRQIAIYPFGQRLVQIIGKSSPCLTGTRGRSFATGEWRKSHGNDHTLCEPCPTNISHLLQLVKERPDGSPVPVPFHRKV